MRSNETCFCVVFACQLIVTCISQRTRQARDVRVKNELLELEDQAFGETSPSAAPGESIADYIDSDDQVWAHHQNVLAHLSIPEHVFLFVSHTLSMFCCVTICMSTNSCCFSSLHANFVEENSHVDPQRSLTPRSCLQIDLDMRDEEGPHSSWGHEIHFVRIYLLPRSHTTHQTSQLQLLVAMRHHLYPGTFSLKMMNKIYAAWTFILTMQLFDLHRAVLLMRLRHK